MSDDSDWAPPEAAADWAPPEVTANTDADDFKSKVGRAPESAAELSNFKAHPELFAGY